MRFREPLDQVFRGRSSVRVLRTMHELPAGMAVSARDVARRAGLSHPTVGSVLRDLVAQGIVLAQRSPGSDGFRLNRDHVLAPGLAVLFEREQGLEDDLLDFVREQIEGRRIRLRGAFVFGSAADGTADETSDIDLAVLCHPDEESDVSEALEGVAEAVRARYGNRLSVNLTTKSADTLTRAKGSRFWQKVIENGRPVIPLKRRRTRA